MSARPGARRQRRRRLRRPATAHQRPPTAATASPGAGAASPAPPTGGACQPAADIYEQVRPAVVRIVNRGSSSQSGFPQEGSGSGIVIDADGTVLTNRHVVDGAETVEVTFDDGTTVSARVVGTDPGNDLAVVQADLGGYQPSVAKLGSSAGPRGGGAGLGDAAPVTPGG